MYTLTIKIAEIGTLLSNGEKSSVGHMWYSISDGNETLSRGYAPKKSVGIWKGKVVENDDSNYQTTYYSGTIVISKTQYDMLKSWYTRDEYMKEHYVDGFYVALWKDCINFTWKALEAIGLNPSGSDGQWWPTWNADNADEILFKALNSSSPEDWNEKLPDAGNYHSMYGTEGNDTVSYHNDGTGEKTYAMVQDVVRAYAASTRTTS